MIRQAKALTIFFIILFMQGCGTLSGSSDSSLSNNSSAPPSAPTGLSTSSANQRIAVSWDAVEGATSYNLYYGTSTGITKGNGTKVSPVTSPYNMVDLNNGTPYYLVITANNSSGEGNPSSEATAIPAAIWVRLGEGTNICDSGGAFSATAMSGSGTPYVVCNYGGFESRQWLDIRQWDGSSWVKMGDNIERTDIQSPLWVGYNLINLLVAEDGTLWLAWKETIWLPNEMGNLGSYVKVVSWDGTSWVQKGDAMDSNTTGLNISNMFLAVKGSTPYLAIEDLVTGNDEDIYVYYWDGSQWTTLGDRLDLAYGYSPQIAFDGDTPYVAWGEYDTTVYSTTLLVKYWDGSQWIQLGDGITPSDGTVVGYYYSFTFHAGIPYLVWNVSDGSHISVWSATNAVWTTDAYTVVKVITSDIPYLTFIGSTPYLVERSNNYDIFAQYWDGSLWKEVNSEIGTNVAREGVFAASNGQSLCFLWVYTTDSDNIDNYAGCIP